MKPYMVHCQKVFGHSLREQEKFKDRLTKLDKNIATILLVMDNHDTGYLHIQNKFKCVHISAMTVVMEPVCRFYGYGFNYM
mgnify:FL=1